MRGLIGLTGNIATGKSEVRKTLAALGCVAIDADQVARDIVAPGTPALARIASEFGPDFLQPNGELDRRKLGNLVFGDKAALRRLEAITHPAARAELWRRTALAYAGLAGNPRPIVVMEVIRLFEGGYAPDCEQIWVTHCPPETQVARLMEHRGLSEAEARARVTAQPPQEEKIAMAHVVIDSAGSREHTHAQVRKALAALQNAPDPSKNLS